MARFSKSELEVIKANPIKDEFKSLLATFKSTYPTLRVTDSPAGCEELFTNPGTLQLLPAASALPSKYGLGDLSGEIALLYSSLSSRQTDIKLIVGLLQTLIAQEEDQKIWDNLYEALARTRPIRQPTTPPPSRPSFTSSFQQTPWSFNTGSFADASEHRKEVKNALREELLPSLRIDIPDFVHAVFGHVPRLNELSEQVFDIFQEGDAPAYTEDSGWAMWPPSAKEELVLEWLQDLMKRFTAWVNGRGVHPAAGRQIYKGPHTYLDGSTIKRKMDVGITACHGQSNSDDDGGDKKMNKPKSNWAQMLVTGELKSNPIEDGQEPAWLDLATYAREVFRTQERRFVLGFTLCGSTMRLWQFDRSGSSGSSSFDINRAGLKFVYVMLGFYLMNDEQLGLDPMIQQSDGKRNVEITRNDQVERFILTEEIKKQAVIVGRATTCWKAYRDGDELEEPLIIKDSWQYEERPEEGELIKEATEKGVGNIARYYHHETIQVDGKNDDTVENVRRGLMKTCGRTTFRQRPLNDPGASASESRGKTVASRSQSPILLRKRSSSSAQMAPRGGIKRSCSSLRSRNSEMLIHNRVHRRVITCDAGKAIYKASSRVAIMNGFIGAMSGHESLLNAGILHRDISIGNIMLTENEDTGFLIDLDLAIKTSNDQASGAPSKTGTKIFMAIGALLGEPHSFMHDLESFFWVLFWICIHYGGLDKTGNVKRRMLPKYEKWNYADVGELAEWKKGVIDDENDFDEVIEQYFTAYYKPLASCVRALRKEVFPNNQRRKTEDKRLYSAMEVVLEKAKVDPNVLKSSARPT
ncbi:MAG: hypothetical protein M1835_000602 [Candelina submexicana]|nr:MAG: hypothetical protein M1835_000602 [Candelina submexicana]